MGGGAMGGGPLAATFVGIPGAGPGGLQSSASPRQLGPAAGAHQWGSRDRAPRPRPRLGAGA
eukprot:7409307-Lingulodinium_polyedra.AAC.1